MARVPAKILKRLTKGLKTFQPIIRSARARDLNESDTVTIVTDILDEVFGYDKYAEVTSEHAIRGTYCDLAIKADGDLEFIIEVKAIGIDLKESHLKQAVDYAANQGVEWAVLTNAVIWRIFRVGFGRPITHELVCEFDLLSLDAGSTSEVESLFLLTREALPKSALDAYRQKILELQVDVRETLIKGVQLAPDQSIHMALRMQSISDNEGVEANHRAFAAGRTRLHAGELKRANGFGPGTSFKNMKTQNVRFKSRPAR